MPFGFKISLQGELIMVQDIESTQDLVRILRKRREDLGLSQLELAKLCNLSHNGISKLENAEREVKLSTLLKMSKFLGLKLALKLEE
jgi:transcriptional regulator with XRE-family HTH domain